MKRKHAGVQVYFVETIPHSQEKPDAAGNAACNFRFETTMRYGKTCKFEDSNIKETSCSRVIAWSVNDLSSLLRPEKKKKKKKRRRGRRKKVAVTALRELLGNSQ